MPEKAWAYYSSGGEDEITLRENHNAFQRSVDSLRIWMPIEALRCNRIWFRPRILRDVSTVNWSSTICGQKSSLPIYIVSTVVIVHISVFTKCGRSRLLR